MDGSGLEEGITGRREEEEEEEEGGGLQIAWLPTASFSCDTLLFNEKTAVSPHNAPYRCMAGGKPRNSGRKAHVFALDVSTLQLPNILSGNPGMACFAFQPIKLSPPLALPMHAYPC